MELLNTFSRSADAVFFQISLMTKEYKLYEWEFSWTPEGYEENIWIQGRKGMETWKKIV